MFKRLCSHAKFRSFGLRRLTLIFLLTALLRSVVCPAAPAFAADTDEPVGRLESLMRAQTDSVLGGLVRDHRSSFAAAVFVQDGRVVFSKAYGLEDPDSATPFSIDATHLDLNSFRKVFTATAVAQLIVKGTIKSIDDPVNLYLTHFKLPPAFGHEVTIRAVGTHSAGFDDTEYGTGPIATNPTLVLQRRFPGYFENPGLYSAYDSYGPKILAYMVRELTGQTYTDYVEQSILRPLGMNETFLVAQPTPPTHRVVAFQPASPSHRVISLPLRPAVAAQLDGTGVSTMSDMGKFVIALLGPDAAQSVITQPMRDLMFQVLQSNGDHGSAHGLLFDAVRVGSRTLFVHGAIGDGNRCMIVLDLPRTAGIFYCYGDVRTRFDVGSTLVPPSFETVNGQMFRPLIGCIPGDLSGCIQYPARAWNDNWNQYLGVYVSFARHHYGFSRLRTLIHPTTLSVEKGADSLRVEGRDGFVEIAPGTFGSPETLETFDFVPDPTTHKIVLSVSDRPSAFERPGFWDDPRVFPRLLAVLVLVALSGGLIVILPGYGAGRRVRLGAAVYASIIAVGVGFLFGPRSFGTRYFEGIAWPLHVVRVCAFLTVPACIWLILVVARPGAGLPASPAARVGFVHFKLICLSSILMVAALTAVDFISLKPIL